MTDPKIDQATINSLIDMTGKDFLPELINTYFADALELLAKMRQALVDGDAAAFGRSAHSFKGNSATFGAVALAAQARELEMMGKGGDLTGAGPKLESLASEYEQVRAALEGVRDAL